METFAPLSLPKPWPFHLVSFERLVRDGEAELARLFGRWDLEMPDAARRKLRVPSQTTKRSSSVAGNADPLSAWRRSLSPEQIAKILRVVNAFGLAAYSEEPEPDYAILHRGVVGVVP
jgi:hypothetical protein